jgi:transposase-like protein
MLEFAPCPKCSSTRAHKMSFTWWGGLLGPSLFTHVKCQKCGTTYNGKTGKSNTVAITIYVLISLIIVIALLAFVWSL